MPSFSYIDQIAREIHSLSEPGSALSDTDLVLYRTYAVLLLAKGIDVTVEDVHNAWSAWASAYEPNNPNLTPFGNLNRQVQTKDQKYADAIHRIVKLKPTVR